MFEGIYSKDAIEITVGEGYLEQFDDEPAYYKMESECGKYHVFEKCFAMDDGDYLIAYYSVTKADLDDYDNIEDVSCIGDVQADSFDIGQKRLEL